MRILEVRRHTMRAKPGAHLTQAGVTLARVVGAAMGPFDLVVTSALPRARETAIAMGFAVDREEERLADMPDAVAAEVDWTRGFPAFAAAIARDGAVKRLAMAQAALWRAIVESAPAGSRALIVSHGGNIEAGALGCVPELAGHWSGPALDYCEGVRLSYDEGRWLDPELLRPVIRS